MTTPQTRFADLPPGARAIMAAADRDMDGVFASTMASAMAALPQAAGAFVQPCDAGALVVRADSGSGASRIGDRRPIDRSFGGQTIRARSAMRCDDVEALSGVDIAGYRRQGIRSLISVPIIRRDVAIGTLKFHAGHPRAFGPRDVTIAQLIAGQMLAGLTAAAEAKADRGTDSEATNTGRTGAARFRSITEALPQAILTLCPRGTVTYRNAAARAGFRTRAGEDRRTALLSRIAPDDRAGIARFWTAAQVQPAPRQVECRILADGDVPRWMQLHFVPVHDGDGGLAEWIVAGIDIDARKTVEIRLRDSVKARDLLVREINHRVKNSLQIATGLLALHADKVTDPQARQRLLEAREQVSTIAQVHQSTYRSARHDHVEFGTLLRHIVLGLTGQGEARRADVEFTLPVEAHLPLDQGIPLALVATEIVTNAIKHARPQAGPLRLTVALASGPEGIALDIADNGGGLPPGFAPDASDGLGMDIIFGLSGQSGGRMRILPSAAGVHYRFDAP